MEYVLPRAGTIKLHENSAVDKFAPGRRPKSGCAIPFALRLAVEGDWVEIISLSGGRGCQERLAGMGLRIGSRVQVLQNDMGGKLLLGHRDARFYIGGGLAHKIQVAAIR